MAGFNRKGFNSRGFNREGFGKIFGGNIGRRFSGEFRGRSVAVALCCTLALGGAGVLAWQLGLGDRVTLSGGVVDDDPGRQEVVASGAAVDLAEGGGVMDGVMAEANGIKVNGKVDDKVNDKVDGMDMNKNVMNENVINKNADELLRENAGENAGENTGENAGENAGESAEQGEADAVFDGAPEPWVGDAALTAEAMLLRMLPPVEAGEVSRGYGFGYDATFDDYRLHCGVDWSAAAGTAVLAALSGEVALLADGGVELRHEGGVRSRYYGVVPAEGVRDGVMVAAGEKLGVVAEGLFFEEGQASHLHWEVWVDGRPVDPSEYF